MIRRRVEHGMFLWEVNKVWIVFASWWRKFWIPWFTTVLPWLLLLQCGASDIMNQPLTSLIFSEPERRISLLKLDFIWKSAHFWHLTFAHLQKETAAADGADLQAGNSPMKPKVCASDLLCLPATQQGKPQLDPQPGTDKKERHITQILLDTKHVLNGGEGWYLKRNTFLSLEPSLLAFLG